jgi:hypothetical protein
MRSHARILQSEIPRALDFFLDKPQDEISFVTINAGTFTVQDDFPTILKRLKTKLRNCLNRLDMGRIPLDGSAYCWFEIDPVGQDCWKIGIHGLLFHPNTPRSHLEARLCMRWNEPRAVQVKALLEAHEIKGVIPEGMSLPEYNIRNIVSYITKGCQRYWNCIRKGITRLWSTVSNRARRFLYGMNQRSVRSIPNSVGTSDLSVSLGPGLWFGCTWSPTVCKTVSNGGCNTHCVRGLVATSKITSDIARKGTSQTGGEHCPDEKAYCFIEGETMFDYRFHRLDTG